MLLKCIIRQNQFPRFQPFVINLILLFLDFKFYGILSIIFFNEVPGPIPISMIALIPAKSVD